MAHFCVGLETLARRLGLLERLVTAEGILMNMEWCSTTKAQERRYSKQVGKKAGTNRSFAPRTPPHEGVHRRPVIPFPAALSPGSQNFLRKSPAQERLSGVGMALRRGVPRSHRRFSPQ